MTKTKVIFLVVFLANSLFLGSGLYYFSHFNQTGTQRTSLLISPEKIQSVGGCAYLAKLEKWRVPFFPLIQISSNSPIMRDGLSPQLLSENGTAYGLYRQTVETITKNPSRGFEYRSGSVIFGASDCSDPRVNLRTYSLAMPLHLHSGILALTVVVATISLAGLIPWRRVNFWQVKHQKLILQKWRDMPKTRRKKVQKALFVLITALAIIILNQHYLGWQKTQSFESSGLNTTDAVIANSGCAANLRVFMVGCKDGKTINYSDSIFADDYGQSILVNFMASLQGKEVTLSELARINWQFNIVALIMLSMLVYFLSNLYGVTIFWLVLLFFKGKYFNFIPFGAGYNKNQIGVTVFALVPCLALIWLGLQPRKLTRIVTVTILSLLAFTIASLFRQSIGMMALIALISVILLLWLFRHRNTVHNWSAMVALLVGAICLSFAPNLLIWSNQYLFGLAPTNQHIGHGFSHNLYLGLGDVANSLGIKFDDSVGFNAVKSIDPAISISSKEYFQAIWQIYVNTVLQNPQEVLRIYFTKIMKFLFFDGYYYSRDIVLYPNSLIFGTGFGVYLWSLRQSVRSQYTILMQRYCNYISMTVAITFLLFILQSIATSVHYQYYYPAYSLVTVVFAIGLGQGLQRYLLPQYLKLLR